jgi:hypothetical protein
VLLGEGSSTCSEEKTSKRACHQQITEQRAHNISLSQWQAEGMTQHSMQSPQATHTTTTQQDSREADVSYRLELAGCASQVGFELASKKQCHG